MEIHIDGIRSDLQAAAAALGDEAVVEAIRRLSDAIEPALRSATRETAIGSCRARLIPTTAVLAATRQLILADPAALLCSTPTCRCHAAHQQRLAVL